MCFGEDELLFPTRVIPVLRDIRGEQWKSLVDSIMEQSEAVGIDRLAFVLLMVRILSCQSCQAGSFRALNGCTTCASTAVSRFPGGDRDLLLMFYEAREDVKQFIEFEDPKPVRIKIKI